MTNYDLYEQWKKDEAASFEGWDFSYLQNRITEEEPTWNYIEKAKELVQNATSVLDMATGGGEVFSQLAPFPSHAIAIEGYEPNVAVAAKRLEPLGVKVLGVDPSRELPFENGEFDLIVNRHGAFHTKELHRILKPGGEFFSQQVSGNNLEDLQDFFESEFPWKKNTLEHIRPDFENLGFDILRADNWEGKVQFFDVGAVVYFLKAIPWVVKGFSVDTHLPYLEKLQEKLDSEEELKFTYRRYLIHAKKK